LKLNIDWIGIKGAIRTAGALMIGNALIAVLVLGKSNYGELLLLFFLGVAAIIGTSMEIGEKS
jgi:hypothetical protein